MQHRYFSPELLDTVSHVMLPSPRGPTTPQPHHIAQVRCTVRPQPTGFTNLFLHKSGSVLNSHRRAGRRPSLCELRLSPPVTPYRLLIHPCCLGSLSGLSGSGGWNGKGCVISQWGVGALFFHGSICFPPPPSPPLTHCAALIARRTGSDPDVGGEFQHQ